MKTELHAGEAARAGATFFLACPSATSWARAANRKLHKVSGTSSASVDTLTNMSALESPLSESCNK